MIPKSNKNEEEFDLIKPDNYNKDKKELFSENPGEGD